MGKAALILAAVGAAAVAVLRRRKARDSAALWHEATSDSSR